MMLGPEARPPWWQVSHDANDSDGVLSADELPKASVLLSMNPLMPDSQAALPSACGGGMDAQGLRG